uniref:MFS domain-containing protein n=1 Tax=Rhabditophanes sp. KR3021 TaxID=114890 RepID=A0AC35U8J4_9BILA
MQMRSRTSSMSSTDSEPLFRVYWTRWIVLLSVVLVNFSNAMTWITYAPITYHTQDFYKNSNAALFLNGIFLVVSIPVGIFTMYIMDKWGLKPSILIGAGFNLVGNLLRVVSAIDSIDTNIRFALVMSGQTLAAIAQPFIMYLPTKMSAYWFPESQRAFSNTLASMSNPLGIAVMYALSPQIVTNTHPTAFLTLNGAVAAIAVVTAVVACLVPGSKPPTPVSIASENKIEPLAFLAGVKRCGTSKSFIVLSIILGGAIGLFNTLYNNLQPALCVRGYSATFSGIMGATLIVSGLVGAAISGIFVDRTKKFQETMKFCFFLTGFAASSLTVAINFFDVQWWIAISIASFGVLGFAIYPIGLEVGVEITFPVAEATSTGIICIMGQIEGIIFLLVTAAFNQQPSPDQMKVQTCMVTDKPSDVPDWKYSFIAWTVIIYIQIVIFSTTFWPRYKRSEYEASESRKLQAS